MRRGAKKRADNDEAKDAYREFRDGDDLRAWMQGATEHNWLKEDAGYSLMTL